MINVENLETFACLELAPINQYEKKIQGAPSPSESNEVQLDFN